MMISDSSKRVPIEYQGTHNLLQSSQEGGRLQLGQLRVHHMVGDQ